MSHSSKKRLSPRGDGSDKATSKHSYTSSMCNDSSNVAIKDQSRHKSRADKTRTYNNSSR